MLIFFVLTCSLHCKSTGYCYRHGYQHQPSWVCLHEKIIRRKLWRQDDHLRYLLLSAPGYVIFHNVLRLLSRSFSQGIFTYESLCNQNVSWCLHANRTLTTLTLSADGFAFKTSHRLWMQQKEKRNTFYK